MTTLEELVEGVTTVDDESPVTESPVFNPGDKVRVSDDATDNAGYTSGGAVRGGIGTLDFVDSYSGWFVRPDNGGYGAYVSPRHLAHVTPLELLELQVASLKAEVESAQSARDSALSTVSRQATEFQEWKDNLQRVALEAARSNDMCGVFDRVMEEVGLEGREREISVRVEFDASLWITVTATSADNARDQIDSPAILQYVLDHPYNVSIDDYSTGDDDDDD